MHKHLCSLRIFFNSWQLMLFFILQYVCWDKFGCLSDNFYTGSGSNTSNIFNIDTSSSFSTKNLNLGCFLTGSTSIVICSNTIAFKVNPCILTGINQSLNSYSYIWVSSVSYRQESNLVSNYFTGLSSTWYFQSCSFKDSTSAPSSQISVFITGSAPSLSFTFETISLISFTSLALYLYC